ncbi:hypothetical protein D9756_006690 [Leucocoprinus leucothites]|uniref:Uncharacterized protein n=1 Tax=Leucocoprinus leucothites TaxID=201217 RepID=A0A8H5G290_9AGAR|nr:hypothetical protein D9756_006690 [Leucoagaricus leucothites]
MSGGPYLTQTPASSIKISNWSLLSHSQCTKMGNDTNIPPDIQAILRLDESFDVFSSMLCSLTYGIAFTLYYIVVHSLHHRLRRPSQYKVALITLGYTTFAIVCATVYLVMTHYEIQMAYVFHRDDLLGGPIIYETLELYMHPSYLVFLLFFMALDWLTMAVQIWRLWILWRATPWYLYVTVLPVSLLLASIGVGIAVAVNSTHINLFALDYSFAIGLTFFGIPPVTTIIVTALMVLRLGLIRRRHINLIGHSTDIANQYTGVISMLIESYALETLWSIAIIITYAIRSESIVSVIFINSSANIKVIALFLIVYRVAKGRAWQAHTEQQISSLRCNDNHNLRDSDASSDFELATIDRRYSTGGAAPA